MSCLLGLLLAATFLCYVAYASNIVIYNDQFQNGWSQLVLLILLFFLSIHQSYKQGWASSVNWADTAQKQSGVNSISFVPSNWDGLYFKSSTPIAMAKYDKLEFYIRGSTSGGQTLTLNVNQNSVSNPKATATLTGYISGGSISASQWNKVTVSFANLGITTNGAFLEEFFIQDGTGATQTKVFLDSFQLLDNGLTITTPPQQITIDTTKNRRVIPPEIYGVNHADASHFTNVRYTVNRKGGNAETRFNWEKATSNRGHDWFYFHIPEEVTNPSLLPEGSSATNLVDTSRQFHSIPMLTAPLIGFVAKDDRTKLWSYSQAKYGSQANDECRATGNAFWCTADAGNGRTMSNTAITTNDWRDTNKQIDPSYVTRWMQFWQNRNTTIKYWSLDNEPHLWSSSHQDVFPTPVTYQGLWSKTVDYARAMKNVDPSIITFGPVAWGYCEYFCLFFFSFLLQRLTIAIDSAADNCQNGADRAANGNIPWLEFYAQKVCEYKQQTGILLTDYLDIHYYPAGTNVALSDDDSSSTAALRLRQLKSLFDPTYTDESWINTPLYLIPRMKELIQRNCPVMKFAITEYNFGNDNVYSAALAQVEVLGIFGREGVDLATRWVVPAVNSFAETAFKLFLNYNGQHANVYGTSVWVNSTIAYDKVGVYAIHNSQRKHVYVILVNKELIVTNVTLSMTPFMTGSSSVSLYGFTSNSKNILSYGTTNVVNGKVDLSLGARSATLAVITIPESVNPSDSNEIPFTPPKATSSGSHLPKATSSSSGSNPSKAISPSRATSSHINLPKATSSTLGSNTGGNGDGITSNAFSFSFSILLVSVFNLLFF